MLKYSYINIKLVSYGYKWRSPSLSELTPMIFNTGLTYLGSEPSKYKLILNLSLWMHESIQF